MVEFSSSSSQMARGCCAMRRRPYRKDDERRSCSGLIRCVGRPCRHSPTAMSLAHGFCFTITVAMLGRNRLCDDGMPAVHRGAGVGVHASRAATVCSSGRGAWRSSGDLSGTQRSSGWCADRALTGNLAIVFVWRAGHEDYLDCRGDI
ncbi:hypothetical protein HPP92_013238 [Vanilla planifolia]|uniref:Uncharacterized protein n=1 Tax=Vanilla planifolia TaxID=51239 RepID=A0A835QZ10_VANPL|nr:hypothetical protein HPP92_013238 [Vanilla planifolia]